MSLILSGTDGLSDVDGTAATPAIRGTDANTGIFFGTDIIGFSEGGVEAARINADSQFVAAAGTAALPVITTTGDLNTGIFFPAADTIAFSEGGAEAMRIDSSGNVGIGTASPNANSKLDVAGISQTSSASYASFQLYNSGLASNPYFRIAYDSANNLVFNNVNAAYNSASEFMRIDSSGNVGIGTTSNLGSSKLDVRGRIRVGTGNSSGDAELVYSNYASATTAWSTAVRQDVGGANNDLKFLRFDSSGTYQGVAMQIDSAGGNLLVGTTSGTEKFCVTTSANASTAFFLNNNGTATNQYGIVVKLNGDPNNVNHMLQCLGGANLRAEIRSNGGLANYSANNVNLSDRREKTNFSPSKSYLDVICAIPVQTFNYIDQNIEEDDGLTLGVVAQDVQAVAPEMVKESNWGTEEDPKMRLSIYQTDLQYALMKCIQEQQALIQSLTTRLTALEQK